METKNNIYPKIFDLQKIDNHKNLVFPLISENLSAGFPSPAMDFLDTNIDLNKLLVKRVSATYFGRVQGESMKDAGIYEKI